MTQVLLERFLRYVSFDTQSDPSQCSIPSTDKQFRFSELLFTELNQLGFQQVELTEKGYLTAVVPATQPDLPCIGFIAHVDTAPDFSGANVKPQIIEDYQGQVIALGDTEALCPKQFPSLKRYIGQSLITTDGTTLLGADNKAGIAEIITALHTLIEHPEIPHGEVKLCFTPDEEIGRGADHFDVEGFGADWAYTIDGGEIGELEYENFNAASAVVTVFGNNCHPGTAYEVMINAQTIACQFHTQMPLNDTPEHSKDYQGFFHLIGMEGVTEQAKLTYIIRDFDRDQFEQRKEQLIEQVESFNRQLTGARIEINIQDSYFNMKEQVTPHMHIIDIAKQAMENQGVEPLIKPIRGGTDGARLSFMGLPCPNLFTGGHNFHGKHEYICIESMQKAVDVILEVVKLTATKNCKS